MKVKIGDRIYDSKDVPIMIMLSDIDKQNIVNMPREYTRYCRFPASMSQQDAIKFMGVRKKHEVKN